MLPTQSLILQMFSYMHNSTKCSFTEIGLLTAPELSRIKGGGRTSTFGQASKEEKALLCLGK